MTIHKCDRCGDGISVERVTDSESKTYAVGTRVGEVASSRGQHLDRPLAELCMSCWDELQVWLKGECPASKE